MRLFFGCRTTSLDLYRAEKQEMVERNIIDKTFLALSREPGVPKVSMPFYEKDISNTTKIILELSQCKIELK